MKIHVFDELKIDVFSFFNE